MRLHRVKKHQALGLSLERIKGILGEGGPGNELRSVLEALLGEVEVQIEALQGRREKLWEMLAKEDLEKAPEDAGGEPYALRLAKEHLGERLKDLSPELLEQERKLWTTLDAFRWPEGYREGQEAMVRYLADHPEEYEKWLALGERLAALAEAPEDSPEVERLARDYAAHFEVSPLPEELARGAAWGPGPVGNAMSEIVLGVMSPAQKRCMELAQRRFSEKESA